LEAYLSDVPSDAEPDGFFFFTNRLWLSYVPSESVSRGDEPVCACVPYAVGLMEHHPVRLLNYRIPISEGSAFLFQSFWNFIINYNFCTVCQYSLGHVLPSQRATGFTSSSYLNSLVFFNKKKQVILRPITLTRVLNWDRFRLLKL
jgi:hypothetical protein